MKKTDLIPYAIIASFIFFAVYIGQFVYRSMQKDLNLVRPDYYAEEIRHQNKIDLRASSIEENKATEITLSNENQLEIQFDASHTINEGKLTLFRSSDEKLDQHILLEISASNNSTIDLSTIKKGAWKIHLNYTVDDKPYLKEQDLFIK